MIEYFAFKNDQPAFVGVVVLLGGLVGPCRDRACPVPTHARVIFPHTNCLQFYYWINFLFLLHLQNESN